MEHLTAEQLKVWMDEQVSYTLVDVREAFEHAAENLGGALIPLGEVMRRSNEFLSDKPVVVYCRKGIRSQLAIQRLAPLMPQQVRLVNLIGGIEAWKKIFPLPA